MNIDENNRNRDVDQYKGSEVMWSQIKSNQAKSRQIK